MSAAAADAIRSREVPCNSWYLDLSLLEPYWDERRSYHHTAPISMIYALHEALALVLEAGLENRWARHHAMLKAVEEWAPKAGFRFSSEDGAHSPTVSSLIPPEGVNAEELNKKMKAEKWTPGSGYGKFKSTCIRIGHMGDVDVASVKALCAAYEKAAAAMPAPAKVGA